MKNKYESIIIFDPEYTKIKYKIKKYKDLLKKYSGDFEDFNVDDMGEKKLAYEIKKHKTGYYVLIKWQGTSEEIVELERLLRVDTVVMKFMTVKMSDDDDREYEEYAHYDEDDDEEEEVAAASREEVNKKSEIDYFDITFNIDE